jgi:hypothetical protein
MERAKAQVVACWAYLSCQAPRWQDLYTVRSPAGLPCLVVVLCALYKSGSDVVFRCWSHTWCIMQRVIGWRACVCSLCLCAGGSKNRGQGVRVAAGVGSSRWSSVARRTCDNPEICRIPTHLRTPASATELYCSCTTIADVAPFLPLAAPAAASMRPCRCHTVNRSSTSAPQRYLYSVAAARQRRSAAGVVRAQQQPGKVGCSRRCCLASLLLSLSLAVLSCVQHSQALLQALRTLAMHAIPPSAQRLQETLQRPQRRGMSEASVPRLIAFDLDGTLWEPEM